MKQSLRFLKIGVFLLTLLTLSHCQNDDLIQEEQSAIATVSFEEAIHLINANNPLVLNRTSEEPFVTPNLENIYQEPLINSNALLTIIPARNKYEDVYSRIIFTKVNGTLKHLVFNMVKDKESETTEFSGKIYLTTLEGDYVNAYKIVNGNAVIRYEKPQTQSENVQIGIMALAILGGQVLEKLLVAQAMLKMPMGIV